MSRLEQWIAVSGAAKFRSLTNEYLAHAAEAATIKEPRIPVNLDDVEIAQKALVRTARAVFDFILCSGTWSAIVPMMPLGFFGTYWSDGKPIASAKRMNDHWRELEEIGMLGRLE